MRELAAARETAARVLRERWPDAAAGERLRSSATGVCPAARAAPRPRRSGQRAIGRRRRARPARVEGASGATCRRAARPRPAASAAAKWPPDSSAAARSKRAVADVGSARRPPNGAMAAGRAAAKARQPDTSAGSADRSRPPPPARRAPRAIVLWLERAPCRAVLVRGRAAGNVVSSPPREGRRRVERARQQRRYHQGQRQRAIVTDGPFGREYSVVLDLIVGRDVDAGEVAGHQRVWGRGRSGCWFLRSGPDRAMRRAVVCRRPSPGLSDTLPGGPPA